MNSLRRAGLFTVLVALVLALTAFAAACGGDDDNGGNGGNGGSGGGGAGEEVVISGKDNFFEPDAVTIPAGEPVTIVFKNEGTAIHNLRIKAGDEEFASDQIVNGGDESTFEVTIDEPGEYEFVCDYHTPDMAGTLTVE